MQTISIFDDNYKPQFSGHESFPIRYGWLEKAFHAVDAEGLDNKRIFTEDSSISYFGVGKNMVSAIRFWSQVAGIIATEGRDASSTYLGQRLLREDGLDPYLENHSSLWRLHWEIASNPKHTAIFWLFNIFNEVNFDRDYFISKLMDFGDLNGWKKPALKTISTDVSVLLSNYLAGGQRKGPQEEALTSPFAELGLIRARPNGKFGLNWGQKPSLSDGVFTYAVCDFWERSNHPNTINFQTLLLDAGSPGRVFLLEENELAYRLMDIEEKTKGALVWSETAGLKQLIRSKAFKSEFIQELWENDYSDKVCIK